ncbi:MAG: cation-translocating P-type ATPase [Bacteroidota bacterium]
MQQLDGIAGLTADEVENARRIAGLNKIDVKKKSPFLQSSIRMLKDPMLILLIVASAIYFITGAYAEGLFMVSAIALISFISMYQESRSKNALEALKAYSQPKATVIREGKVRRVSIEQIVPGDYFIVEEGEIIPADGVVVRSNDFMVNESILTGESMPVVKSGVSKDSVYYGTLVSSGLAICKATATGIKTRVAQIGKFLHEIKDEKSPLQVQVENFVHKMAIGGSVIFVVIWAINYVKKFSLVDSLLKALTLAMSILPEEIPVAFATFMALGAWRLVQLGIIVKQTKTVETLGSATVICVDKTGTLTKNEMKLIRVFDLASGTTYGYADLTKAKSVIAAAMWASEPIPFDPMEKALHNAYAATHPLDERPTSKMIHEYPLSGVPPIMTHVFEDQNGKRIIAAKGAPEAFLKLCALSLTQRRAINTAFDDMANQGFRILGVADVEDDGNLPLPEEQHQFKFTFKGLVAFHDPPKENIPSVLESFYKAGIAVKIITGDNTITAQTIARLIRFKDGEIFITGEQIMALSGDKLQDTVNRVNIFTRMFPEAKLKVIEALKRNNHIVAMIGDGVNDGPALKAAHIGIAMGSKGSEVAKEASALVLSKDDLAGMVNAIAMGRKIYNNLKKAIQYIISIHIPTILIVFLPLVFNWPYPVVFTPVHIIFLELIMGPTCSIIYENEPIEKNLMNEKPRTFTKTFFRITELLTSLFQGLAITTGLIVIYWYAVNNSASHAALTSMVFVTLITANIFLTLTNRSLYFSMITTLQYQNRLIPMIISITIAMMILIFTVTPLRSFFGLESLTGGQLILCVLGGIISVVWFEGYKWKKRKSITGLATQT